MKNNWKNSLRQAFATAGVLPLLRSLEGSEGIIASVVMVTRNRASYLNLSLAAFERQAFPSTAWELIVIEEPSSDDTASVLDIYKTRSRIVMQRHRLSHRKNRADALKCAVEQARGSIVLFVGDDMIVDPTFVLRHVSHHLKGPCVVLGNQQKYIHSHLSAGSSPVLREITRLVYQDLAKPFDLSQPISLIKADDLNDLNRLNALTYTYSEATQNWYSALTKQEKRTVPPWLYFSRSNASANREQLLSLGVFDPSLRDVRIADADLGFRLYKQEIPFISEQNAIALCQFPPVSHEKSSPSGRSLSYFFRKHPGLQCVEQASSKRPFLETGQDGGGTHREICVVWCVRGRGLGHATRDFVLYEEIKRQFPGTRFHFVSYGNAVRWLQNHGLDVKDLGDKAGATPRVLFDGFSKAIQEHRPDLVVSDEELIALAIAKSANIPSVYITNWMLSEDNAPDCGYIHYAKATLFPDLPGSFSVPEEFAQNVHFGGPWIAAGVARAELETVSKRQRDDCHHVLITAGQGFPEDIGFVLSAVRAAQLLPVVPHVTVLGGALTGQLVAAGIPSDVSLLDMVPDTAELFRSADVVITRGGHTTLWELAAAGVPAIAIPRPRNRDLFLTDYALRFATLGTCLYLPEVLAVPEHLTNVLHQVLLTPLGTRMRHAARHIDFDVPRRHAASYLLDVAMEAAGAVS